MHITGYVQWSQATRKRSLAASQRSENIWKWKMWIAAFVSSQCHPLCNESQSLVVRTFKHRPDAYVPLSKRPTIVRRGKHCAVGILISPGNTECGLRKRQWSVQPAHNVLELTACTAERLHKVRTQTVCSQSWYIPLFIITVAHVYSNQGTHTIQIHKKRPDFDLVTSRFLLFSRTTAELASIWTTV